MPNAFMDMRNDTSATFEGVHRVDHRAYPPAALREALLNAIVHRDYAYSASTLISVYRDRMEIVSVGGLIPGFHLNDVTSGLSICRNPKLANVFYRLSLIEAYGTGLQTLQVICTPLDADDQSIELFSEDDMVASFELHDLFYSAIKNFAKHFYCMSTDAFISFAERYARTTSSAV